MKFIQNSYAIDQKNYRLDWIRSDWIECRQRVALCSTRQGVTPSDLSGGQSLIVESPLAGRLGLMNAADHQWPNSSATYYHLIQAEWRTFSHCLDLHLSSTKPHSREEGLFCVCSLLSGEFCEASASSMELQSLTGRSSVNGASSFF